MSDQNHVASLRGSNVKHQSVSGTALLDGRYYQASEIVTQPGLIQMTVGDFGHKQFDVVHKLLCTLASPKGYIPTSQRKLGGKGRKVERANDELLDQVPQRLARH